MTDAMKKARYAALTNAEEFIRNHIEGGIGPEDMEGIDFELYTKACYYVANLLGKKADKLLKTLTSNK